MSVKKPKVSIVMAYHNEGQDFLNDTVNSILDTADIDDYEIIIVDDHSKCKISVPQATVIRHNEQQGPGSAFNTGVYYAKSDNIILMGCDIRFAKNKWMSRLVETTEANPSSLICTCCAVLRPENVVVDPEKPSISGYGANLIMSFNDKGETNILAAKWINRRDETKTITEIPAILGAIYGVRKKWYRYIDGGTGHRIWGTLEPLYSIKSYMFGGNCLCHQDIVTWHIFRGKTIHGFGGVQIRINKVWVSKILFDKTLRQYLLDKISTRSHYKEAIASVSNKKADAKRAEYHKRAVYSDIETMKLMKAIIEK